MSLSDIVSGELDGFHPVGYTLSDEPYEWSDSELISWARGQLTTSVSSNKVIAELRNRYHYPASWLSSQIKSDVATRGQAVITQGFLYLTQAIDRLVNLPNKAIGHGELHAAMMRMLDHPYEVFVTVWTQLLDAAVANPGRFNGRDLFTGTAELRLTTANHRVYIRLLNLVLETKDLANRNKVNKTELRNSLDQLGLIRLAKLLKFYGLI